LRGINFLRRNAGICFAFVALIVAQAASTQYSFIYYQDSVPEKLRMLNNKE